MIELSGQSPFAALTASRPELETQRALMIHSMQSLRAHRVFSAVQSFAQLRRFMEWHVFAVWDFMSLVKRLQAELTCVSVPWIPRPSASAARFINEIVLGEESDTDGHGGYRSHFEIYLDAMRDCDACTTPITEFIRALSRGRPVRAALDTAGVDTAIRHFVLDTVEVATSSPLSEVLGNFCYGRENIIPAMFSTLLVELGVDKHSVPGFVYYLKRHIDLDGDSHGPAAERLIGEVVKDGDALESLYRGALRAIEHRTALWDALADELFGLGAEPIAPARASAG